MTKESQPNGLNLEETLGESMIWYRELTELTSGFKRSWDHSTRSGWAQKVYDGRKALFYLFPRENSFNVNFTLREAEREEFMHLPDLAEFQDQLREARKYSEGFALSFRIADEATFASFLRLMTKLMEKRRIRP